MFGYVIVNQEELKGWETEQYRTFYCGLCQSLNKRYGKLGQIALNYDLTFVAILLTSLYEPETTEKEFRCFLHPTRKRKMFENEFLDYAADMTILLAYYKAKDDWEDEKKIAQAGYRLLLEKKMKEITALYPNKAEKIQQSLKKITQAEQEKKYDIDLISGYFGDIMAIILAYKQDEWYSSLSRTGFYLGKFIYLMDAYDDIEKDIQKGNYNPFIHLKDMEDFQKKTEEILEMMMAECSDAFEHLPIIENAEILRNIIYSGVWIRYEIVKKKRSERK